MSKYLDEAGVKELLKLVRKYVDLKTNNIPANFEQYKGVVTMGYMLHLVDPYIDSGISTQVTSNINSLIASSGVAAADYNYLYIEDHGSVANSFVRSDTSWISNLTTLMPNLTTVYIKFVYGYPREIPYFSETKFEALVGSKVKVVWL